jgi:hypothetical protein
MTFRERLNKLGFDTYGEYLSSPHWLAFRESYRRSGQSMRCRVCSKRRIQLHHRSYFNLGREQFADVVPLCRDHHTAVHEWLKANRLYVQDTDAAVATLRGEKVVVRPRVPKRKGPFNWRVNKRVYTPAEIPVVAQALRTARLSKNQRKDLFRFYQVKTGVNQTRGRLNKRLAVVLTRVLRDRPQFVGLIGEAGSAAANATSARRREKNKKAFAPRVLVDTRCPACGENNKLPTPNGQSRRCGFCGGRGL